MKKALVLGASGGMGYSIVKELSERGIAVTAFARTKSKLEKLFGDDGNITIFSGDIFKIEDFQEAAKGVDIIFQSANIPYTEWEEKLALLMSNIVSVAKAEGAKLAIVDNIYAYGRNPGQKITEATSEKSTYKKGEYSS